MIDSWLCDVRGRLQQASLWASGPRPGCEALAFSISPSVLSDGSFALSRGCGTRPFRVFIVIYWHFFIVALVIWP